MANAILTYNPRQTTEKKSNDNEVYSDVSMVSKTIKTFTNTDSHYTVSKSLNVRAVENAIENIFNHVPGERLLYPEFGTTLRYLLYNGITDYNVAEVMARVNADILKFDRRVIVDKIENISSTEEVDDNTIHLRIIFHIADLPNQLYSYEYSYVRAVE